jgi:hypothetical protein
VSTKLPKEELKLETQEVRVMRFMFSISLGLMSFIWSLAYAQTNPPQIEKTSTPVRKSTRPKKVQPKQSSAINFEVLPLEADGVIRTKKQITEAPSFAEKAEDVSNKLPRNFVEKMISEGTWIDAVETAGTPANIEMQAFIASLRSGMAVNSLADQIVMQNSAYSLSIELIRYFETARNTELSTYRLNSTRVSDIKNAITQKYLAAVFTTIQSSTIAEYQPIVAEFRSRLYNNSLKVLDLSPELRKNWSEEKNRIKVHQYENFGLEEKKEEVQGDSKVTRYLISGVYIDSKRTLAVDLARKKNDNLITIAHEMVHAADPELFQNKAKLDTLFRIVVEKLRPHLRIENAEVFVRALIQDTFYEMGRIDFIVAMQKLSDLRLNDLKLGLVGQPLEKLAEDKDFKDFMRTLIGVTVENEYKAYTLSYALYQNKKDQGVLAPLLSRNNFMQEQFKHKQSLPFTLSVAMNPFVKNTYLGSLITQGSPELASTVGQIKSIFEKNYLEQSKVMIEEVGLRYDKLFTAIQATDSAVTSNNDEPWQKPNNFESPTNPYRELEVKIATASIIKFKMNLEAFLKKIVGLQETLMGMSAGMMDLHDVNFGELKLLGMQPEKVIDDSGILVENHGQLLPETLDPRCRADVLSQIQDGNNSQLEEYNSYFAELRWRPETRADHTPITQAEVMGNLYRLNLLKAVRWLRMDFPKAKDTIADINAMIGHLQIGNYNTNEITPQRAKALTAELQTYMKAASVTADEFKSFEILMTSVSEMYYMALYSKWQPVADEFASRLRDVNKFLRSMGFEVGFNEQKMLQIKKGIDDQVGAFRQQVQTFFAKECGGPNAQKMSYFSYDIRESNLNLGRYRFPVTGICYDKNLYIFRQTCNFNRSATTSIRNDKKPLTKMFYGGRQIILEPFISYGR